MGGLNKIMGIGPAQVDMEMNTGEGSLLQKRAPDPTRGASNLLEGKAAEILNRFAY